MKETQIPKIAEIHLVPYILHQDQGFIFHIVVLKIWLIFSKKVIKLSTRKTFFSKKIPSFCPKEHPNSDQDVSHNCPRHPNLHAHGPY